MVNFPQSETNDPEVEDIFDLGEGADQDTPDSVPAPVPNPPAVAESKLEAPEEVIAPLVLDSALTNRPQADLPQFREQTQTPKKSTASNAPEDIFGLDNPDTPEMYLPMDKNQEQDQEQQKKPAVALPPIPSLERVKTAESPLPTDPIKTVPAGSVSGKRRVGRGSRMRVILLIVASVLLVITSIIAYYPRISGWFGADSDMVSVETNDNLNQVTPVNTNDSIINTNTSNVDTNRPVERAVDSDGDGLTDEQEKEYGTDAMLLDTDSDGLTDREEVAIYKTNPLSKDTDKDNYSDGEEVRNFYNPNGKGKLIDVEKVIEDYENQKNSE